MTILRALYQPELRSGMSRGRGRRGAAAGARPGEPARAAACRASRASPNSRAWATRDRGGARRATRRGSRRLAAAALATQIAAEMRPIDHRLGVSLLTLGRLSLRTRPAAAAPRLRRAPTTSSSSASAPTTCAPPRPGCTSRRWRSAPASTRPRSRSPTATRRRRSPAQNAILLAGLLSIKAEALAELGDAEAAQAARLDSLRWARYGFGDTDGALAREQAQLAALLRLEKDETAMLLPLAFVARRAPRLAPRRPPRRRPPRPAAVRRRPRHRSSCSSTLVADDRSPSASGSSDRCSRASSPSCARPRFRSRCAST